MTHTLHFNSVVDFVGAYSLILADSAATSLASSTTSARRAHGREARPHDLHLGVLLAHLLNQYIVASVQEQMRQNEEHIKELKDSHMQRELDLQEQIAKLRAPTRSLGEAMSPRTTTHARNVSEDATSEDEEGGGLADRRWNTHLG
jgi:TolA-binding protein